MKNTKFDRVVSFVVIGTCLIKAVLYGGSKPPATTNEPPDDANAPTNEPAMCASSRGRDQSLTSQTELLPTGLVCEALGGQGLTAAPRMTSPQLQTETEPSALHDSSFQVQNSWTARGAYCEWTRVDFPDGFAFPHGTNLVASVTLMAYGEIRENLRCSPSDFALSLPLPVSLEPGVSTCAHGLTASNSYLFAWTDACVERSRTNRVDAAIELFASGDMQVRFGDSVTNVVARPPEGFVGFGQDDAWLASVFPGSYVAITNKGYEAWLVEDVVGINVANGMNKVSVTVDELPEKGPCYLVVGPFKVVVTSPGTYLFPIESFAVHRAYTCPTWVPLRIETDDGFRIEEEELFGMSAAQSNNPNTPNNQNNPNNRTMLLASPGVPDYYLICIVPNVYVVPSHVPLEQAVGTRLRLFCNCTGGTWDYETYLGNHLRLTFGFPSYAEIRTADVADRVIVLMRVAGHECSGVFFIDPPSPPDGEDHPHHQCCSACCGDACRCDGTCCMCNCGCHSSSNGNTNTPPYSATP